MKRKIKKMMSVLSALAMTIAVMPKMELPITADDTASETILSRTINNDSAIISSDTDSLTKHTDNGDTQIETPEKRAEFEVYLKSAGSYANADTNERDVIVCDKNGKATVKTDLPMGSYYR